MIAALRLVARAALGSAALLGIAQPAGAGSTVPRNTPGAWAPRDECASLPGAAAFRKALGGAISRRDAGALAALAAPDIRLDFGGGAGRAELRKRLAGPEGAELWRELAALLPLGCARSDDGLVVPWIFAQDLGDLDPFDAALVAGPMVPIYTAGNARGRRAAWLNWQLVVPRSGVPPVRGMQLVGVVDSKIEGYVAQASLRGLVGYRLFAAPVAGKWAITAFVAGD